ncbi:DgyrCDS101 [Dimorphilus gyrociliatus]|uniref:DgyrCDS101 n=1 Tax=Dimorphilus gyrociliatus TaxID=2664684 RepID=A0A7I8V3M2_9ANNE|nr:DgyrCDS101 [Dimorphilus gyrociliatus]
MGYHPQYLDAFQKTQQFLLRGDGPLPHEYRHYIAIMASARHYCNYIVKLHTCEFIMQGGDPEWLEGIDKCPKKLQDLNELNMLMAHQPWKIKDSHIKDLTSGQRKWTLSEVMHAVVLLAHFHSLSSFVYGCGVSPELDDSDGGYTFYRSKEDGSTLFDPSSSSDPEVNGVENSNEEKPIKVLMESMRQLHDNPEASVEEKVKAFESIDPAFDKSPSPPQSGAHEERQRKEQNAEFMKKFIDNPGFAYEDFSQRDRSNNPTTFRAQDFSWDEQGFSLTNRLYPDLGQYLDEKFKIATTLTYYTMGNNLDVDTTAFRRAIWNYIHCMFGIRHDDYDYREVNVLLERSLKQYIKTITCYPEKVTRNDFKVFMKDFKQSEKVHVNLMLLEARLQGELLYALNAITRFMT